MIVKLLAEQHLAFLSLKGGRPSLNLSKMSNCWKSHAAAQYIFSFFVLFPAYLEKCISMQNLIKITVRFKSYEHFH